MRALFVVAATAAALVVAGGSPAGAKHATASSDVYQGLGTWIDVYDAKAFVDPDATAASIASHGVRTVYIETSNSKQTVDIVRPGALGQLVDALKANGIAVVAWYLPTLVRPAVDLRRSLAALHFVSPEGRGFDGFALDIEAPDIKRPTLRNARVLALSRQLRVAAGADLALGAIIPSPRGMEIRPAYWPDFPYTQLAAIYDAFLPMTYFTGSVKGPDAVYGYLARALAILRVKTQNPELPIHLIAGVADRATLPDVLAFAQVVTDDTRIAGWSLYDFETTRAAEWRVLAELSSR